MDFRLPEELTLLKEMVRDFVDRELKPHEDEVERANRVAPELRKSIRDKARDVGLLGLNVPEEEGGAGLGVLALCVVREELGRTSYAMAQVVKPTPPLLLFGNEDQKEKYLRPYMRNEREYAFALSEPDAGSDAAAIQTTAVPDGDAFVLNGTKHFTTDGDIADFFFVFALTDKETRARGGVTAFLIDRETPGFTVGRPVETLGWRGIGHVELVFQDCRVPAASVLGEVGEGFRLAMRWIGHGRLSVASYSLGVAQSMLDLAVDHSRQRETFGKPISDRQAVQWMLVESAMEIYAGRGMVRHA
ncbi:MAG: acyl-CoA dehydrogenase family protein, partial [Nitrospinota bacterium]|nr:acyl-CoA dehydrogenase family protein [Nitrospinota bacterium]